MRSLPVTGPTGNGLLDEGTLNPTGIRFSVPGAKALYVDELGYKNRATPGVMENWLRFGAMYNQSSFTDFTKLGTGATISGNSGIYFLADRQLWQQAPDSPHTAYRGLYAGVSAMYAPPAETPISQYYEARAYWIGPFDTRASDLVSFVYNHQVFSHYLADELNASTAPFAALGLPVPTAHHASNSYTLTYLAHIMPGVYASVGVGYTDHPSVEYFKGEGSALNFLSIVVLVF
jgi:porin